jgi:hypothetical protein
MVFDLSKDPIIRPHPSRSGYTLELAVKGLNTRVHRGHFTRMHDVSEWLKAYATLNNYARFNTLSDLARDEAA